ncbi:hypothetical protein Leryth_010264 [Lithospermum erythrorhizon]|nr:hypothetical protein Leryth_010264 [Lithospermum erythrorhizon]
MDSGKFSGHKTNFSQTCYLLSQYLKENGSFGDLSLGLSANFQPHGASTNVFPDQTSVTQGEPEKAQMTIFYGGQVIVLDEFPADKVKEIMTMAGTQNPKKIIMGSKSAESATNLLTSSSFGNNLVHQTSPATPQPMLHDLPIARKASLARFFEKRKDRLTAKAPYQTSSMGATSKPAEGKGKPWLGLAAQPPLKLEHQS